jgi:hypothetical protein
MQLYYCNLLLAVCTGTDCSYMHVNCYRPVADVGSRKRYGSVTYVSSLNVLWVMNVLANLIYLYTL